MTMKEATDFLIEDIMKEIGLNKTEARKALAQAMTDICIVEALEDEIKFDLNMDEYSDGSAYID